MKAIYTHSRHLRVIDVVVTNADADAVELVELPAGAVHGIKVAVEDAFNTGAVLDIGVRGDPDHLVNDQAIDVLGVLACTLAEYHSSTKSYVLTATVSDKTAAGRVRVIVEFSIATENKVL